MRDYSQFCDDYYLNMVLQTELDLPTQRDTLLHYFEQMQKRFSSKSKFFARDKGDHVLEEDRESGSYRWTSVESKRLQSGIVNPETFATAVAQHELVLEIAPYALSLSTLDCESLSVVFGFDYQYTGNQSQLIADALGVPAAFTELVDAVSPGLVAYEPAIQFSLEDEMQTQARLSFETRGNPFQPRDAESVDASDEVLSVYLTLRRFENISPQEGFVGEFHRLVKLGVKLLDEHVVDGILKPLQNAIAAS